MLIALSLLLACPAPQDAVVEARTLVIYEVGDLCRWADPEEEEPAAAELSIEAPLVEEQDGVRLMDAHRFAELLAAHLEPAFVEGADQLVPLEGGNLVALLQPAQHRWLETALTRHRDDRINLLYDAVILTGPAEAFEALELSRTAGWPTLEPEVAERAAMIEQIERLKQSEGIEERNHLKLVAMERQDAVLLVGNTTAYVKDYEVVEVEPSGMRIADPKIGTLHEGLRLKVNGAQFRSGRIAVDLDFLAREVERPIPTFETTLPGTTEAVTLALPSTSQIAFRDALDLPEAHGALYLLQGTTEGDWMAIYLFATILGSDVE